MTHVVTIFLPQKTDSCLPFIVSTMVADNMAREGSGVSVARVLTEFTMISLISTPQILLSLEGFMASSREKNKL